MYPCPIFEHKLAVDQLKCEKYRIITGWRALTLMMYEIAVRRTYVQGTPSADRVSASCLPSTPGRESTMMTRKDPRFTRCADTRMLSTNDDLHDRNTEVVAGSTTVHMSNLHTNCGFNEDRDKYLSIGSSNCGGQ